MKVLVLSGDVTHPSSVVHTGLDHLAKGGRWQFDYVDDMRDCTAQRLADYSVAVLVKRNTTSDTDDTPWVTDEIQVIFRDWVAAGNGLLVMHSGTVVADFSVLLEVVGGCFQSHPAQLPVTSTPVAGHPMAEGVAPMTHTDEHLHIALTDENADVFMHTSSDAGTQPGGWRHTVGDGRVCALTPGHHVEIWLDPNYQRMIENCLAWCAGR